METGTNASESGEGDIFKNTDRYLNMIKGENKFIRRNAVKSILTEFKKIVENESAGSVQLTEELIFNYLHPITYLIKDGSESTREMSCELLDIFIHNIHSAKLKEYLPTLIPILVEQFGQPEINEPCEEVRLLGITILQDLIKLLGKELNPFIDDIIQILSYTITDPFNYVRQLSCEVTCQIADACRTVFHYNSERLLRPLCISIRHQHSRVRVAALQCIGQVVLLGNHKGIEAVLPYVTQRLFDDSPKVRNAVVMAVGSWMVDHIDRYSYFYKLLPLMMSGLSDEVPFVSNLANSLWSAAGSKYLEETIEQNRDLADFPPPRPVHYPKDVTRPNLGCRILTWHNVCNILPAIANEVTDWLQPTRIKSSQLLYQLILNCEEKVTMHVEKILGFLSKSTFDEEPVVVKFTLKSAKLIGYFVPLSVTWPIVSSAISQGATDGNLSILGAILGGTDPIILGRSLNEVTKFLSDSEICQSLKTKRQECLLSIAQVLMNLVPVEASEIQVASDLFRILSTVLAQTQNSETGEKAQDLLTKLGEIQGLSLNELMGHYSGEILKAMIVNSSEWTSASTDRLIFEVILSHGGLAVDKNMDTILEIMISNLNPDKDPEVRLKFFTMLAKHLKSYSQTTTSQKQQLQIFVKHIIKDVLDPNLVWKAGKAAGVLRTAAASCLLAILDGHIIDPEVLMVIAPIIVTSLIGIVEDTADMTRLITCGCFEKMIVHAKGGIGADVLHKIYPVMLKRLDDVSNVVRIGALNTIAAVFTNLPNDYDTDRYRSYLAHTYTTLLVHLDDSEETIQDKVQGVLEQIGHLRPDSLVEECEKTKMKHRTPVRCNQLIETFKKLNI